MAKPAEFAQTIIEQVYDSSVPMATDHPLASIVAGLCKRAKITHVPELRDEAGLLQVGAGAAITGKNALLFHEPPSDDATAQCLAAHELGHLVFGDDYRNLNKQAEYRADRFMRFLTDDPTPIVAYLRQGHIQSEQTLRALKAGDELERRQAREQEMMIRHRYGNIEDRIANIERPVSEREEATFRKAIAEYDKRIERSAPAETPPLIPASARNESLPERTARLMELADRLGSDKAALRLANVTERLMNYTKGTQR